MFKYIRNSIFVGLVFITCSIKGQTFNPTNPSEPTAPEPPTISLYLKAVPEGAGVLNGAGKYKQKTEINITAKANNSYKFLYWANLEGDTVSINSSFKHIKTGYVETLVAHFTFVPSSPSEPVRPNVKPKHLISVLATHGGAAIASAKKLRVGETLTLTATPQEGYSFDGWYLGDTLLVSNKTSYSYTMPDYEVSFTARFKEIVKVEEEEKPFNPTSPVEPNQPIVKTKHSISVTVGDGGIAVADAVKLREGEILTLTATPNDGYNFNGWYLGDTMLVSNKANYSYTMPDYEVSFTARFKEIVKVEEEEEDKPFNPSSPGEPEAPELKKHSIYLMSMAAKPGDTTYCDVFINVAEPLTRVSFQLNFPSGAYPSNDSITWSERINSSNSEVVLLNDSTMSITINEDSIAKGGFRLMSIAVAIDPDFPPSKANMVSCNQVSLTHKNGINGTCSTRNSSLNVYKFGDADNSGVIDVYDLVMARDFLYGMSLNNFEPIAVDLNRNGGVDEDDIQMIIQLIMNR